MKFIVAKEKQEEVCVLRLVESTDGVWLVGKIDGESTRNVLKITSEGRLFRSMAVNLGMKMDPVGRIQLAEEEKQ